MRNTQFFLFLSTIWITLCGVLLAIYIWSEPKYHLAIYKILYTDIKAFSRLNLLNSVLNILSLTFDAIFTYFHYSRQLSVIHQKLLNVKNIENVHMKTLNQFFSNFHSPSRNPMLENQLTGRYEDVDSHKHSYKNMLRTYTANLLKRVPAGVFPHKSDTLSFH